MARGIANAGPSSDHAPRRALEVAEDGSCRTDVRGIVTLFCSTQQLRLTSERFFLAPCRREDAGLSRLHAWPGEGRYREGYRAIPTYCLSVRTALVAESGQDRGPLYCPYAQHALAVQERPSACSRRSPLITGVKELSLRPLLVTTLAKFFAVLSNGQWVKQRECRIVRIRKYWAKLFVWCTQCMCALS